MLSEGFPVETNRLVRVRLASLTLELSEQTKKFVAVLVGLLYLLHPFPFPVFLDLSRCFLLKSWDRRIMRVRFLSSITGLPEVRSLLGNAGSESLPVASGDGLLASCGKNGVEASDSLRGGFGKTGLLECLFRRTLEFGPLSFLKVSKSRGQVLIGGVEGVVGEGDGDGKMVATKTGKGAPTKGG